MALQMVFTASPLGAQHERDRAEEKPVDSLVILRKAPNVIPPSSRSVYPSWWPSLTKDLQAEHELTRKNESSSKPVNNRGK